MSDIISITFPIQIKKCNTHNFKFEIFDDYIDGEEVEHIYPFANDINRIALIKPSGYDKVLIVTSAFNVRYTNWETVSEAKRNIQYDDLVANCVTINGKKEYIVSREDDDIDDVYLPLVRLTHIDASKDNYITAYFKEAVKGAKKHTFRFELTDNYFDSEDIDAEYDFNKDFNKISLVKTPLYPKVLLITQTLKLMLTDWDTIEEAEEMIDYDDLKAFYVHIDGKSICLIANSDQDISDVYLQVPIITEVSDSLAETYTTPKYYETNTRYERLVKNLSDPTFSDFRDLSVNYVNRNIDEEELNDLFEELNHGETILETNEQLYAYMYCFGRMHEAKLRKAFEEIPNSFFRLNKKIAIIDYACGQGLATLCLNDYINDEGYDTTIQRITLIEPSPKALSRAALHCHKVIPEAIIDTQLTTFDEMDYGEIPATSLKRIHLLSNILDMDCYDLKELANIIKDIVNPGDIFVCVDPWYHDQDRDGRQQRLMRLLKGKRIYHDAFNTRQLVSDKTWTAYITVFKI